jgi:hypothetical protein
MLMQTIIDRHGFANFRELHRWSIDNPDVFGGKHGQISG